MARHAALAAGLARFFAGPLMSRALLVRCFAALAGNLALLGTVHRRESAILFSHTDLHNPRSAPLHPLRSGCRSGALGCNRSATAQEERGANPHQYRNLASVLPEGHAPGDAAWKIDADPAATKGSVIC